MIKKPGHQKKYPHGHKAPKGTFGRKTRPKLEKGGKGSLSDFKNKPKPPTEPWHPNKIHNQYPKGHPLSPTLEQDRLDALEAIGTERLYPKDAFEEADPVLPDPPKTKPKFGLFELPW